MEYKRNEATKNRPEGDRVLDAPHIFIDIQDFIDQLKKEPTWDKNDRNGITVFKTDRLSMVLTGLHKKSILEHEPIDGISIMQVIEGKIRVRVSGEEFKLGPGQIMTFHPGVDYTVEAKKESFVLLTVDTGNHDAVEA